MLQGLPVGPDVVIGLTVLAAVPVASAAPPFVGMAKGDLPYAVGLMLIVAFLCVPLTPLILALCLPPSEAGLEIDPWKIIQTLLTAQLIPLSVGMTIQHVRPRWAEKLLQFVPTLALIGIVLSLTLIAATQARQIVDLGVLPHLTALLSILVCLLIGNVMMRGEAASTRAIASYPVISSSTPRAAYQIRARWFCWSRRRSTEACRLLPNELLYARWGWATSGSSGDS